MNDAGDKGKLLGQLRIDRHQDDSDPRLPWIAAGTLALLVLAGAAFWWWRGSGTVFEVQLSTAALPAAASARATAVLQATGYVTARRQATVSAQITGKLTEVLIEEGERVAAGQVLARLEDHAQRAQLAETAALVAEARAYIAQFESELEQARRDYARQQDLAARQLVSAQAVEAARTQLDSLTAQLAARRQALLLAQAQQGSAQVQLDYTTVRAPFTGVVIAKAAQVGEIVSPLSAGGGFTRTGIGTLVDMDSLEIEVDVNESYLNRVVPGGPAEAVLDAYQNWTIPAHVIAIIPTADRGKATVRVRIGLDDKDPRILPDMGARVSFLASEDAQDGAPAVAGVLVPASAVVERNAANVVFIADGARARAQPVTVGQSFGDLTQVEGLAPGARIVRVPDAKMNDGASIREEGA